MMDTICEAREALALRDQSGWGFAAEYIEEHDARRAAEGERDELRAEVERLRAGEASLLRVIAAIRAASGVGDGPMLYELAEAIRARVGAA